MSDTTRPPGGPGAAPTWDKVHECFHALLALAPAEREARLAELATDEPALEREVRSLLAAHAAAEGYLEAPPVLDPAAAAPGDRIGPWRIVGEIGRGGMGVVFRAVRDDGDFGQQVAIKLIAPGMRSIRMLSRFREERRILARLEHPNIARLVDGGTAPDGSPYLAMEFVEGESLLAWCETRHLDVNARLALFLTVCDAVQFAHQQLVIHRDIKSENILVTGDGSPRLLDFGVARLVEPEADGEDATVTVAVNRLMTPDFASPEQVRGDLVGVASDVYSLGAVLYELLTGARPLRFRTRSSEEVRRVVMEVEPVRPSVAVTGPGAEALRRRLAGDLDVIVLKALEKDPARRYGSVAEFAEDLRRHLDGRTVRARKPSASYRFSRTIRRHRTAVLAGSLVALALVAGLVATSWQAGVARHERDRATRRFRDVRELAHAVVFDLHDAIAEIPGSTRAREMLVRHALRYLDDLAAESATDPALQRELAQAYARIGDVQGRPMFANLGRSTDALASYRRSLALYDAVARSWPESVEVSRERIVVNQRIADVLRVTGKSREAREAVLEGKRRIRELLARDPDSRALARDIGVASDRLADLTLAAGDTAAALAELRDGAPELERAFRRDPRDPAFRRAHIIGQLKLAQLYTLWRRPDSAFASLRRAEPLATQAVADQPDNLEALRDLSIYHGLLGLALSADGQLDSALTAYQRGLRMNEELAARDPNDALEQEDLAAGEYEIGTMLRDGGRHAEAAVRFAAATRRWETLAAADTGNSDRRINLARSLREAGEACRVAAASSPSRGDAMALRERARRWFVRGLAEFRALEAAGALPVEDRDAARWIAGRLSELGRAGARGPAGQSSPTDGRDNSR